VVGEHARRGRPSTAVGEPGVPAAGALDGDDESAGGAGQVASSPGTSMPQSATALHAGSNTGNGLEPARFEKMAAMPSQAIEQNKYDQAVHIE